MVILTYFFRGNPAVATYSALSDKQQGDFYMHFPTDRSAYTTAFDERVVDHWLERKTVQTANGSTEQDQ